MRSSARGVSLIELLIAVACLGVIFGTALPQLSTFKRRSAVRAAGSELATIFRDARSLAAARSCNVAVRFRQAGARWLYSIYVDGDFDGVHNDDIAKGIDTRIGPERAALEATGDVASIALPPVAVNDPDTGKPLTGSSPVRFGSSLLCSFAPNGASTPGSVYLSDRLDSLLVVRVLGSTGRVRTLRYNFGSGLWR